MSDRGDRIKRPSFQWYPGDHRRDLGVQACSFEARALWGEMRDLMHDGEPYGHLTAGGVPIMPADLARLVGKSTKLVTKWLKELEDRKVFSRANGVIYSRRMVRDEAVRNKRASGGGKSLENENVPKPKDGAKDDRKDPPKDGRAGSLDPSLRQSSGGSPAFATATASASATEPVAVGAYALACTIRANQGLAEHPTRPQPIARIIATNGSSHEAAEQLLAAGVPLAFAEAEIYRLAKSHKAEDWLTTLNYFPKAVVRAWKQRNATEQAGETARLAAAPETDPINAAFDEAARRLKAKEAAHA